MMMEKGLKFHKNKNTIQALAFLLGIELKVWEPLDIQRHLPQNVGLILYIPALNSSSFI